MELGRIELPSDSAKLKPSPSAVCLALFFGSDAHANKSSTNLVGLMSRAGHQHSREPVAYKNDATIPAHKHRWRNGLHLCALAQLGSEGEVRLLLVGSYFLHRGLRDHHAFSTRFSCAVTTVETDQPQYLVITYAARTAKPTLHHRLPEETPSLHPHSANRILRAASAKDL